MDPGKNRFSGKVYTRRNKKMDASTATASITLPKTFEVPKSEMVSPQTQDLFISNSATPVVVPDGCCGDGAVDRGYGGGGGSQPIGNDEVAIVTFVNDNPAVIGGVVERGKRIRKDNKYYNNSEFLLAKDRLPYARPLGRNKKLKNNKEEKKPSVSPQVSWVPVPKKPRSMDLKNKREMTNAEVSQNVVITSSGSKVVAAFKASGTGEMYISASSTHADNARSCSSD